MYISIHSFVRAVVFVVSLAFLCEAGASLQKKMLAIMDGLSWSDTSSESALKKLMTSEGLFAFCGFVFVSNTPGKAKE